MVFLNPGSDEGFELLRLFEEIVGLVIGCHVCHVVVNLVALTPAGLEICGKCGGLGPHPNLEGAKSRFMVAGAGNPVSAAGDDNRGELQHGVVGRGKPPVGGHFTNSCVFQVPLDDGVEGA